jgi:2-methylcitrate dehydratase PrpD
LGECWETMTLCLKRFPMHATAHTAVQAVLELQAEHTFTGAEVEQIDVQGTERMATVNNIPDPTDIMMAQYSIPFCVALAAYRDPRDPASFDDGVLRDAGIRSLCARVNVRAAEPPTKVAGAAIVTITLKGGRTLSREVEEFNGTPARPLSVAELRDKFVTLTRERFGAKAGAHFDRLQNLEAERDLSWVGA